MCNINEVAQLRRRDGIGSSYNRNTGEGKGSQEDALYLVEAVSGW